MAKKSIDDCAKKPKKGVEVVIDNDDIKKDYVDAKHEITTRGGKKKLNANTYSYFAKLLADCNGIITDACKLFGTSRETFYKHFRASEDFRNACEKAGDIALDFVESALFKQIKAGNTQATIFYLKTKGKKRGYVENEIDKSNEPIQINFKIVENNANTFFEANPDLKDEEALRQVEIQNEETQNENK